MAPKCKICRPSSSQSQHSSFHPFENNVNTSRLISSNTVSNMTPSWKKRKRNLIEKRNIISLISRTYYNVIFQTSTYPLILIISAVLLLFTSASVFAHPQSSSSSISSLSPSVINSNPRLNDNVNLYEPEGFFYATNGSSYAVISDTLLSDTSSGHYFGLSFRTCTPGELLKQNGDNSDELKLTLTPEEGGKLRFSLTAENGDHRIDESIGTNLLDAKWHTVLFQVSSSNDKITIHLPGTPNISSSNVASSSDGASVVISNQEVSDLLNVLDLSRASPQLKVGTGFIGCIREGPKVRFSKLGVSKNSEYVKWGHGANCLLPYDCSGKNCLSLQSLQAISFTFNVLPV